MGFEHIKEVGELPSQVAQRNASLRRNTAKVVVICSEGQPGIRFGYGAPGRDIESILAVRLGRGSLELCGAPGAVVSEGQAALTQNRQESSESRRVPPASARQYRQFSESRHA